MRLLLVVSCLLLAACQSFQSPPLVAAVDGSVIGHLRASPDVIVAAGEIHADASLGFRSADGIVWPLTAPLDVERGEVLVIRREPYTVIRQKVVDPLPTWALSLYQPGEWSDIVDILD